ncbi:hypothetical protein ATL40_0756 [Serinibacter salmoneus]|uniref:Uncharacterized protein n=1 Tax=Serinibacter salmoneus TaxID=556530 RepID=A0A2A9D031_9MICO|nr:hypothetical protein ATL40_0756 [Serinibacter salmoneus]
MTADAWTPMCAVCARMGGPWFVHRGSLTFVCESCRWTRAAHLIAFPECRVSESDQSDGCRMDGLHADEPQWVTGGQRELVQWVLRQWEAR